MVSPLRPLSASSIGPSFSRLARVAAARYAPGTAAVATTISGGTLEVAFDGSASGVVFSSGGKLQLDPSSHLRHRPVEALAHFLAGLKERDDLAVDGHLRPGTRVASVPRPAAFHGKHPETANLDPVAASECDHDFVEDRIEEFLHIALIE